MPSLCGQSEKHTLRKYSASRNVCSFLKGSICVVLSASEKRVCQTAGATLTSGHSSASGPGTARSSLQPKWVHWHQSHPDCHPDCQSLHTKCECQPAVGICRQQERHTAQRTSVSLLASVHLICSRSTDSMALAVLAAAGVKAAGPAGELLLPLAGKSIRVPFKA